MKKKRIRPQSAKAKGRRLQQWVGREIAALLNTKFGPDEMIRSREMGQSGTDVVLLGWTRAWFPFSIECKSQESWSVPAWIQQARENQDPDTDWVLFMKKRHNAPVVVLDAEVFLNLMRRLIHSTKQRRTT